MFCKKSKFWNKVIHKSKNGVDCISDNENKHKDHHCILDDDDGDDDDDDDLNLCNPFTVIKILYDDNSPLDDQDYDHEDYVIDSEYCSLISNQEWIIKKYLKRDKDYDFNFGSKKYHYIAATRQNKRKHIISKIF